MAGGHHTQSPTKRRIHQKHKKKVVPVPEPANPTDLPGDDSATTIHRAPPAPPAAPLERCISQILLARFEQDVARLYSTHLTRICQHTLPALMLDLIVLTGPGWIAANASKEDMKAYFRGPIAMDLRQAGERVATKSVLWSYTAIRHFAVSHDLEICARNGVHSQRLLPFLPQLEAHLASLKALPPPSFAKPQTLGPLFPKFDLMEKHCHTRVKRMLTAQSQGTPGAQYDSYVESITRKKNEGPDENKLPPAWQDWRTKLKVGYDLMTDTVWEVANEFNPTAFGSILRDKLENKWCDCGCSTDHLGEVCEPAVREEEEEPGHRSRAGKGREWDGRGSGVKDWGTLEEEDVWESKLDFGYDERRRLEEMKFTKDFVEMRYVKAEREKEVGNKAFKEGRYKDAIEAYSKAHTTEPEMAHYQLNIAAAHLKLSGWIEAEEACTKSLHIHRSEKGFWRRSKARQMLGKREDAIQDLREILKLQPNNVEALTELTSLLPKKERPRWEGSSGSMARTDWSAGSGSGSANGSSQAGQTGAWKKLPFELHDVDFTPLRIVPTKKSWPIPGKKDAKESYVYPTWDSYDIQSPA